MKKKALLLALAALVLVVGSVAGTMAYLTSTQTVTNTFTVGNITMALNESALNADGSKNTTAPRVTSNSYKALPGALLQKDPKVTISQGSESCYLFVKITDGLNAALAGSDSFQSFSANLKPVAGHDGLYFYSTDGTNAAIINPTGADFTLTVFDGVQIIPSVVTSDNINSLSGKTIVVKAFAYQSANTTAAAAQTAAIAAIG